MRDHDLVGDALHAAHFFRDLLGLILLLVLLDRSLESHGAVLDDHLDRATLHNLVGGEFLPYGVDQKIVGNRFARGDSGRDQCQKQYQWQKYAFKFHLSRSLYANRRYSNTRPSRAM